MPAKRLQLNLNNDITQYFSVYVIETHLPDYKLTLRLNQRLRWRMRRMQSFRMFGEKPGIFEEFTLYHYEWNDLAGLFLVIPLSQVNTLMPLSYFIIRGSILLNQEKFMISQIAAVEDIERLYKLDLRTNQLSATLRNTLINLLTDLEFHVCEKLKPSEALRDAEVL